MTPQIFQVAQHDLNRLTTVSAVDAMRFLLSAEAAHLGIPITLVDVPTTVSAADGGVDATVDTSLPSTGTHGVIFPGHTSYQVKTGAFSLRTQADIKKILLRPKAQKKRKKLTKDDLNDRVRSCLDDSGTLVIALFGCGTPDRKKGQTVKAFAKFLSKIDKKYAGAQITVWKQQQLMLAFSCFPALALQVKEIPQSHPVHGLRWMRTSTGLDGEFFASADQHTVINQIRSGLKTSPTALVHIRYVGEPGIGKTRLVFEALNRDDCAPLVLYAPDGDALVRSPVVQAIEALAPQTKVILVVDECNPENRTILHRIFNPLLANVRLITIFSELDDADKNSPYLQLAPPALRPDHITDIIKTYGVGPDDAIAWAKLCDGSPRVAHAVGASLQANTGSVLKANSLDDIWLHYIAGKDGRSSPKFSKRRLVLCCLSLFKRFGWKEFVKHEAVFIHSGVIQKIDPGFSWNDLVTTVDELIRRRILQGGATLYITPRLLHIKLWCDWWDLYSSKVPVEELLSSLKPPLDAWFGEMFKYAGESRAASDVAKRLLAPDGPLAHIKTLNTSTGAALLFHLAQAEPGAALRCLQSALGSVTVEDLRGVEEGRRYLVNALEHIALYEDHFHEAAELLLSLAEAENEDWSNNATGIFAGLFTLGYGKVAASELPPGDRLSVLDKALRSASPIRRSIGLKAFDQALQTRFIRMDIGDFHGLKRIPKRWMPATYGDLFAAYSTYWSYLVNALEYLNDEDRAAAVQILLSHSREIALIQTLGPLVARTLKDLASKGYAEPRQVIERVVTILHYDKSGLESAVQAELEDLNNFLTGRDLASQLKRHVGMDLLEDKFDEKGELTNAHERTIARLAEEALKEWTSTKQELSWLVTPAAKNGYLFGYDLGLRDINLVVWTDALTAMRANPTAANDFFIGGYLKGIHERDVRQWEKLLEELDGDVNLRALLPLAAWRSGMSPHIAELILARANAGSFDLALLGVFRYGGTARQVPADILNKWITLLLEHGYGDIALELFDYAYLFGEPKREFPLDLAEQILASPKFFSATKSGRNDQMVDYHWKQLALQVFKRSEQAGIRLAKLCFDHFGEDGAVIRSYGSQAQELLDKVLEKRPKDIWDQVKNLIGPPQNARAFHILNWLRGEVGFHRGERQGPLTRIPRGLIWEWIDQDRPVRAPYLAQYVPMSFSQTTNAPSLCLDFMIRYGHDKSVRSAFHANYNTEGWAGPASEHYAKKITELEPMLDAQVHSNIRRWAREEIEVLRERIRMEKVREERQF